MTRKATAMNQTKNKKPKKTISPTQLSLRQLRSRGWHAQVVEHWNPWVNIRQDLFGVIDIVAVASGKPILAVQTTSRANIGTRIKKIMDSQEAKCWAENNLFLVHGWDKPKHRWRCKVVRLTWNPLTTEWTQEDEQ